MEKEWPPLKSSAQYKCGMLHPYMKTFDWETKPDDEEGHFYYEEAFGWQTKPDDEEGQETVPRLLTFKVKYGTMKEFLRQVRNTRGYDVNIDPPHFMETPFWLSYREKGDLEEKTLQLALACITLKMEKPYKHVKNVKSVYTINRVLLLTFTAKAEDAPDAEEQTFYATAFVPPHALETESELLECFMKPDGPAPWSE